MAYSKAPLLQDYKKAGLTEKQWRWDWMSNAGLMQFITNVLYKYCDDDDVDVALRKITKG